MSTIRVPPALRATVGSREVQFEGDTVGQVLDNFSSGYPSVRGQLFEDDGTLKKFVNVYLNEQDIQYLDSVNTPVAEEDTIIILPAMAGGAKL